MSQWVSQRAPLWGSLCLSRVLCEPQAAHHSWQALELVKQPGSNRKTVLLRQAPLLLLANERGGHQGHALIMPMRENLQDRSNNWSSLTHATITITCKIRLQDLKCGVMRCIAWPKIWCNICTPNLSPQALPFLHGSGPPRKL